MVVLEQTSESLADDDLAVRGDVACAMGADQLIVQGSMWMIRIVMGDEGRGDSLE